MQSATRLPDHFYETMVSWLPNFPSIRNNYLLFCIAIDSFDKKVKSMSKKQLGNYDAEMLKLCTKWADDGKIPRHPRKIGVN